MVELMVRVWFRSLEGTGTLSSSRLVNSRPVRFRSASPSFWTVIPNCLSRSTPTMPKSISAGSGVTVISGAAPVPVMGISSSVVSAPALLPLKIFNSPENTPRTVGSSGSEMLHSPATPDSFIPGTVKPPRSWSLSVRSNPLKSSGVIWLTCKIACPVFWMINVCEGCSPTRTVPRSISVTSTTICGAVWDFPDMVSSLVGWSGSLLVITILPEISPVSLGSSGTENVKGISVEALTARLIEFRSEIGSKWTRSWKEILEMASSPVPLFSIFKVRLFACPKMRLPRSMLVGSTEISASGAVMPASTGTMVVVVNSKNPKPDFKSL